MQAGLDRKHAKELKCPEREKMKHVSLTLQVENDLKHQLSIGALKPGARLITKKSGGAIRYEYYTCA